MPSCCSPGCLWQNSEKYGQTLIAWEGCSRTLCMRSPTWIYTPRPLTNDEPFARCSKNPQLLDTIFLRLKTLSRDQKRLQMILYQVDVMGHIQMFISQVVAVGDTGKRHWAVCCCSALSLLSALPIAEKFTPRSKNLFQTLVTLFRCVCTLMH